MHSMTGYGSARGENGRQSVAVSLRGVNGRYLDLNLRLREEYRASEAALRDLLTAALYRGRVEVNVEIRRLEARRAEVEVHEQVVRALHCACQELATAGMVEGPLTMGDVLRIPEAFEVRAAEQEWGEAETEHLLEVAGRALEQLLGARRLEGEKLAAALEEKLAALEVVTHGLEELREPARQEAAESLQRRLEELLEGRELDDARLAQEVAVLTDRMDFSEEMDRLRAHLEHFREVMERPGAVGKRLDFLAQEIFRELNTLGAKCRNAGITRLVLDAKVLGEQLREQVQNVE